MNTSQNIEELKDRCEVILDLAKDKKKLINRNEWGEINFNDIEPKLDIIVWVSNSIVDSTSLSELPDHVINGTHQQLETICQQMLKISEFDIKSGNAAQTRDNYASNFRRYADQVLSQIGLWLPVLALRTGEIENWQEKCRAKYFEIKGFGENLQIEFDAKKEKYDSFIKSAQEDRGQVGAEKFTKNFEQEANAAKKRAIWWVVSAGIFGVIIVLFLLYIMFSETPGTATNVWDSVYLLGSKAIFISVLFVAATFCSRVALANFHLESVNRHRATSLQTLRAFRESVGDESASDTIAVEAARAAFENIPTGFIAKQTSETTGSSKTMEFIKQTYKNGKS